MQVFGLPGHLIRNGGAASRLIAAKTPNIAAAIRRDAVARWRSAMAKGLSARGCGQGGRPSALHPLSLGEGARAQEPPPAPAAQARWPPALVQAVEALRRRQPDVGQAQARRLLLRREGFAVSDLHRRPHPRAISSSAAW